MSEKRKDKRGRILRAGESQRADGRYTFKYTDSCGKSKYVYSWRLDKNDATPKGKKQDVSLREKENQIHYDAFDNITSEGGGLTVLELVKRYIVLKPSVKHNTMANYQFVINIIEKEDFGKKRIDKVNEMQAMEWLVKLQKIDGRGYSSIHSIRGVIRPAFKMAVKSNLIRHNPFEFELAEVVVNDSVRRDAITRKQMKNFLEFVEQDKHFSKYYDAIYILFHTGLRISEFVGLTINDIVFEERKININHQLQRTRDMKYVIEEPKTEAGNRSIPMENDVSECFKRIIAQRGKPAKEPMVDGKVGFLFLDKNGNPMVALHWEKYFQHICEKYNQIYKIQMPKVTPHVCRHTYCSNKAHSGMNPNTLKYIMGHSDISVTLNYYTHTKFEDALREVEAVSKREKSQLYA